MQSAAEVSLSRSRLPHVQDSFVFLLAKHLRQEFGPNLLQVVHRVLDGPLVFKRQGAFYIAQASHHFAHCNFCVFELLAGLSGCIPRLVGILDHIAHRGPTFLRLGCSVPLVSPLYLAAADFLRTMWT